MRELKSNEFIDEDDGKIYRYGFMHKNMVGCKVCGETIARGSKQNGICEGCKMKRIRERHKTA